MERNSKEFPVNVLPTRRPPPCVLDSLAAASNMRSSSYNKTRHLEDNCFNKTAQTRLTKASPLGWTKFKIGALSFLDLGRLRFRVDLVLKQTSLCSVSGLKKNHPANTYIKFQQPPPSPKFQCCRVPECSGGVKETTIIVNRELQQDGKQH